jgi:hypothetical protein
MGSHHSGESDDADAKSPCFLVRIRTNDFFGLKHGLEEKEGRGLATTRLTILAVRES